MFRISMGVCVVAGLVTAALAGAAYSDIPVWEQGFETDTAGWLDADDAWSGDVTQVASGFDSIASASGGFHAIASQAGDLTSPYSAFDGYRDTWPGGFTASIDIYLDTTWLDGAGFDYSVAANGTDNMHQRDFIWHVTQDTSSGDLLVAASNNTNFAPREDLETISNYAVATSGWFTFEQVFYDDGGDLAVDMNLYDSSNTLVFTTTLSDPSDDIPTQVGGNRYSWFTHVTIDGGVAIDNHSLTLIPGPGALALLAVAGLMTRRRRTL